MAPAAAAKRFGLGHALMAIGVALTLLYVANQTLATGAPPASELAAVMPRAAGPRAKPVPCSLQYAQTLADDEAGSPGYTMVRLPADATPANVEVNAMLLISLNKFFIFIKYSEYGYCYCPDPQMAVYSSNDGVSGYLANGGAWEIEILNELLKRIGPPPALVIDVGANIGYYTLVLASRGYDVIAFEPLRNNQRLLNLSLCLNPAIAQRVTLFPVGLSTQKETCHMARAGPHAAPVVACAP